MVAYPISPMKTPALLTFSAAVLLAALSTIRLEATLLYWDANGTTAGAGATPAGTWGTDAFWNSDTTGAGGGSFTATTTSADTLYFSAGPNTSTTSYTVTVGGTQAALGLQMQNLGAITLGGGTLNLGAGGITIPRNVVGSNDQNSVTINSDISLQASQTWSSNMAVSGGAFRVTGNISGTGNLSLQQLSSRLIELSGGVNHAGAIISTGTNTAGATISGNIGSNVTEVRVTTTAALKLSGTNTYSGNTLIGGANFTNPTLRVAGNSALAASTNVIMSVGGTSASATLDLGDGANSYNATVAGLSTTGSNLTLAKVTNGSTGTGTATLTINPDGASVPADSTFAGIIQDGATAKVALTKTGGQTLTLNGANTYTGATRVTGGTLALGASGSLSANSALTVGAGAVFDAQALASYAFSAATTTTVGVGAASSGQIKVAEALFNNANLVLDFGSASSLASSYTVLVSATETGHFGGVTATGTSISGTFIDAGAGNWTLTSGGYTLTFSETAGTLTTVASAVPEPSVFALLAGVAGLACAAARRSRKIAA